MSGPDQPTNLHPLPEPEDDHLARILTEVLADEATRIDPAERLDQIRDQTRRRRRPWLPVAAASAAAVLLIGGGTWAALDRETDSNRPPTPIASSPTISPAPTPAATPTPTVTATPTEPSTPAFVVPVYFLGSSVHGLFREFLAGSALGATPTNRVQHALQLATNPAAPQHPGDSSPWLPSTSSAVQVTRVGNNEVVVHLPAQEAEAHGRTPEQARLAAQQLVWTATATLQDAHIQLRIVLPDRADKLFGSLSTTQTFHRPPADRTYEDLAAIWILQPLDGDRTHSPVSVGGQACTFEANVAWQVVSGRVTGPASHPVRSGRTTASSGCPIRGTWSVKVTGLAPGTYTFVAYEPSPKGDGSYEGLDTSTFVVG